MRRPTGTLRAFSVLLLFGAVLAACRGCGCIEGEKTYETLDGKVKVAIVRNVHWTSGRIPGPETKFFLRVSTEPVIDHPLECNSAELAEDTAGKLVAYRCEQTKEWNVLRLRGADRYIFDCKPPVGETKKPAFDKLPSVRRSARRILDCGAHTPLPGSNWAALAHAVTEDEGADAAIDFVVESAAYPSPTIAYEAPWHEALDTLPSDGRAKALARVCASLERDDTPPSAYARAARNCRAEGAAAARAAVAQMKARFSDAEEPAAAAGDDQEDPWSRQPPRRDTTWDDVALLWSAAIATKRSAAEAATAACAAASTLKGRRAGDLRIAVAAEVIARTKTRCPDVLALLEPPPCDKSLDCDGGLCSAAELARADEGGAKPASGRTDPEPPSVRALLAAAYVQGPLPDAIQRVNARRHYTVVETGAPHCGSALELGAPCSCVGGIADRAICRVKASDDRGAIRACNFHFDDAHEKIDDIKRICQLEGSACDPASADCCGQLQCVTRAKGFVCERPDRDASR